MEDGRGGGGVGNIDSQIGFLSMQSAQLNTTSSSSFSLKLLECNSAVQQ